MAPSREVSTEQLIEEYSNGMSLADLATMYGFKNANSVYVRLRRYGFTDFRRDFGKGFTRYHGDATKESMTCPPLTTAA